MEEKDKEFGRKAKLIGIILNIIVIGTFLIVVFFFLPKKQTNDLEKVQLTYISGINGRAFYGTANSGYTKLLMKDHKEYLLKPSVNHQYDPTCLCDFIKPNDSIFKKSYNDTIYIIRDHKKYMFVIGDLHLNSNYK